MAVSPGAKRRLAWSTGLRALLILLFGIYAVISPGQALATLVLVAAAVLLVSGVLGLWGLTFGGRRSANYWWDVVMAGLAIIVGILILISPLLAALLTVTFLVYLIAFEAIIHGVMEIVVVNREREQYARIWPQVLQGVLYVLFGIALLFWPLLSALVGILWLGILMIIFSIGLFGTAWRLYQQSKTADGAAA